MWQGREPRARLSRGVGTDGGGVFAYCNGTGGGFGAEAFKRLPLRLSSKDLCEYSIPFGTEEASSADVQRAFSALRATRRRRRTNKAPAASIPPRHIPRVRDAPPPSNKFESPASELKCS